MIVAVSLGREIVKSHFINLDVLIYNLLFFLTGFFPPVLLPIHGIRVIQKNSCPGKNVENTLKLAHASRRLQTGWAADVLG